MALPNDNTAEKLIDNPVEKGDNLSKIIDRVNDDMSLDEVRELFLAEKNHAIAQALAIAEHHLEKLGAENNITIESMRALKGVYERVNIERERFTEQGNIERLEQILQSNDKARKGSYLAGDIQRYFNEIGNPDVSATIKIPGEHNRTNQKVEKLLEQLDITPDLTDTENAPFAGGILERGANNARAISMPDKHYSISGSNSRNANSKQSLTQKIKNIFTGGAPSQSNRENIRRMLEAVTAMSTQWGKIDPSLNAIYDKATGVGQQSEQKTTETGGLDFCGNRMV